MTEDETWRTIQLARSGTTWEVTDAYNALLKQLGALTRSVTWRYVRDPDTALSLSLDALMESVNRYDPERGLKFVHFYAYILRRRIYGHITHHMADKRDVRRTLSLDSPLDGYGDSLCNLGDLIADRHDYAEVVDVRDELRHEWPRFSQLLSKRERNVYKLYACGLTYEEIAHRTSTDVKSIDNALARVAQKLRTRRERLRKHVPAQSTAQCSRNITS